MKLTKIYESLRLVSNIIISGAIISLGGFLMLILLYKSQGFEEYLWVEILGLLLLGLGMTFRYCDAVYKSSLR